MAAQPQPKPHPFAVEKAADLRGLLQDFYPGLISAGGEMLTLQLPSTRSGPLASPELPHDWDLDWSDARLAPWQVQALRLPLPSVAQLLAGVVLDREVAKVSEGTKREGAVVLGADLHYWRKAFDLVLEVLAAQLYVPAIDVLQPDPAAPAAFQAVWKPVLAGSGLAASFDAIARAMPPLCRSEVGGGAHAPHALLRTFVCAVTDHLARSWGAQAAHRLVYVNDNNGVGAWLKAMVSPQGRVAGAANQLHTLAAGVRSWQLNLAPAGDSGYAIALRLLPPAKNGGFEEHGRGEEHGRAHVPESGWQLEYLLQARDESGLLVPAEQVWQSQDETLVFQQHRFHRPQERLLAGLGRAAKLFSPIERSLQAATPVGVDLSTTEVYTFLRQVAPLLQQSGFRLILPPWWEAAAARLGLRLYLTPVIDRPPDVSREPESGDKPVAYRWELVLGDTALTPEVFAHLVQLSSPLVQRDGQWLRLDPEQIEAAQRFWQRQNFAGRMDLKQAMRVALGLDDKVDIAGLPVYKAIAQGWLPDVIDCLVNGDQMLRHVEQPPDLRGRLRPYQRSGFAWLHTHRHLGLGALLADDMGLGKSVQAIAMLLQERAELRRLPAATLLICPTSLLGNWRREFERFAPDLRVFIHYGPERPRQQSFGKIVRQYDVILTSYTLARLDNDLLKTYDWYGLILDEAQKIKNPDTQVTQAVNQLSSAFRMALTGTPVENHLIDLWSLFNFLNRGYLGSQASFRKHFALPIERYQDPVVMARLQRMVRPFILRRLKSDPAVIQDLPQRLEMKVYCTLSEEQATLYQAVVEEGLPRVADARGRARRIHVFNLLTRLKQILNHPVHYQSRVSGMSGFLESNSALMTSLARRSGKLDRLHEMLDEVLEVGDKALVFTQFAEMGSLLTAYLQQVFDRPVFYLHGGVPASRRNDMIVRFQEDLHAPSIFVLTLKTGGLGLNLTAANHVFHFDRWWNPAVENQASDRVFRIGQTRNVQIHQFITAGTLEEAIDDMLERKKGLADAIISGSGDESWIAELSNAELTELLVLNKARV